MNDNAPIPVNALYSVSLPEVTICMLTRLCLAISCVLNLNFRTATLAGLLSTFVLKMLMKEQTVTFNTDL